MYNLKDTTTFQGTSFIPMETGLDRRQNFSFSAMPSPNISDLAKARKDPPPTAV